VSNRCLSCQLFFDIGTKASQCKFSQWEPESRLGERRMSKKLNLDAMSVDEIWQLHEEIIRVLSARLTSEKRALESRLSQLSRETGEAPPEVKLKRNTPGKRRKYPKVFPKYRNPNEPSETWSGRGKKPRWLTAALKAGHSIEEFVIKNLEPDRNNPRQGWARSAGE
jgi:DNA-binding protein H-NS